MNLFYSQKGNTTKVTQYILCIKLMWKPRTTSYYLQRNFRKGEYTINVCIAKPEFYILYFYN